MIKKSFIYFYLLVIAAWIGFLVLFPVNNAPEKKIDKKPEVVAPTQEEKKPVIGKPASLFIPKINVNAPIESIGMNEEGRMGIPNEANNAAWYNLGYKPGEQGSAVIAGHYDAVTGAPAIFYNLQFLETGDEIIVVDENNRSYNFVVTAKESYSFDSVPLQQVFADSQKSGLNLITCNGSWDNETRNYTQRMVVYSQLLSSTR